jgi:(p)ppGpp synthase/HD superfamily hydrolase
MYKGQSVEVQIRTQFMHQVAEYGMASHWAYKDEKKRNSMGLYNTPWLSSIKEWQQDAVSSRDFVDCVRRELLGKRVFVFLRNGKILNLARGATAVDAAFQIHTEVGLQMHGVEINGKPVPISYELKNGDVVSILTRDSAKPSSEWMRFAKSRSTRSKLRAHFRSKQTESYRKSGEMLFIDYLDHHRQEILDSSYLVEAFEIPQSVEELSTFLPGRSQFSDVDELLIAIGKTHDPDFLRQQVSKIFLVPFSLLISLDESRFAVSAMICATLSVIIVGMCLTLPIIFVPSLLQNITRTLYASQLVSDEKVKGERLSFADVLNGGDVEFADVEHVCHMCLPVRGDTIMGTKSITANAPTIVHRLECPYAQEVMNNAKSKQSANHDLSDEDSDSSAVEKNRVGSRSKPSSPDAIRPHHSDVPVRLIWPESGESWQDGKEEVFLTEVAVVANDRKLLLADCSVIASKNSEILKTGSSSSSEHCILEFLVRVRDLGELQSLMDKLGSVDSVMSVERRVSGVVGVFFVAT